MTSVPLSDEPLGPSSYRSLGPGPSLASAGLVSVGASPLAVVVSPVADPPLRRSVNPAMMTPITRESSGTAVTSGGLVAPDEDSPSIDVVLGARSKGLFTTRRVALLRMFLAGRSCPSRRSSPNLITLRSINWVYLRLNLILFKSMLRNDFYPLFFPAASSALVVSMLRHYFPSIFSSV